MGELTREELSLLLYLESRAVDNCGRVDAAHMNVPDHTIVKHWAANGFVEFGRIVSRDIAIRGADRSTHWVRLSKNAWVMAHAGRHAKADRAWVKRRYQTTAEARAEKGATDG